MCFSTSDKGPPDAYRIKRPYDQDDHVNSGEHIRTRVSLERNLQSVPVPVRKGKGGRYPKKFNDSEGFYPSEHHKGRVSARPPKNQLYEFPTRYPNYEHANQNTAGHFKRLDANGRPVNVDAGNSRLITDENARLKGVSYHPHHERFKSVRANEIFNEPLKGEAGEYEYRKGWNGRARKVR